jgi:hypothetical protein
VFSTDSSKNLTLTKANQKKLTKKISVRKYLIYTTTMPITKLTEEGSLKNYLCLLWELTVPSLLSFMTPNYVDLLLKPGDPRLKSEFITYESPKGGGKIKALLSQPTGRKKLPGIIVVHENRGLNPYIEDVGRRAAVEGFITRTRCLISRRLSWK